MSAAGAQTVVMRFISSQVSKMSSQAGFWACFSQFSSLASGLRVISASPSPGRALYKGVILPEKKKNPSAMSRWRPRSRYRESRRWTQNGRRKWQRTFLRCVIQWMCRRWLAAQHLRPNYSECRDVFQFHTGMRSMLPICRSTTWLQEAFSHK